MTSLKMMYRVAMVTVLAATMVSSSLVTMDAQPCNFAGTTYNHGQMIQDLCVLMICVDGVWQTEWIITNPSCRCCEVYGDPHFTTFDQVDYSFQGSCNYSIAQMGRVNDPHMGVFGQFQDCSKQGSCLDTTTYKEDANTVITLQAKDHTTVEVNGVATLLTSAVQVLGENVLASTNATCSIMLGASKFVIKHCKNYMTVCAPLSLRGQVDGLCGHFDHKKFNDFMDRKGELHDLHPTPSAFPTSWKTAEQASKVCSRSLLRTDYIQEENEWDVCLLDGEEIMGLAEKCHIALSQVEGVSTSLLQTHLGACVEDLCIKVQNGEDRTIDAWLEKAQCTLTLSAGTHNKDLGVQCLDPELKATSFINSDGPKELSI